MKVEKEMDMQVHEFRLILDGGDWREEDVFADAIERLYEAGCDDAVFSMIGGVSSGVFDREAETREEAIASARADVERAGVAVIDVREVDDRQPAIEGT